MKIFSKLFHFLGSIYFAIGLIAIVALMAIAGTFMESLTESHRYAARFTYGHPAFNILLWCFFINILFSSLRRWPFKSKHIPFLITHFGLLMILAGALVKSSKGTQGTMGLLEGGSSDEVFVADTYELQVEQRDLYHHNRFHTQRIPLQTSSKEEILFEHPTLQITLLEFIPHVTERYTTWIKGDQAFIDGLPPFAVHEIIDPDEASPLPISLHHGNIDLLALRTDEIEKIAQKVYLQGLTIQLTDRQSGKIVLSLPLNEVLQGTNPNVTANLHFNFSSTTGFTDPLLVVRLAESELHIPLSGSNSLLNLNQTTPYLGTFPIAIDLKREATIALIEDRQGDVHLLAYDPHGRVHHELFPSDQLTTLVAYDQGFGGYAMQTDVPFPAFPDGREDKEKAHLRHLTDQLHQAMHYQAPLAPPLALLRKASERAGENFEKVLVDYLYFWDQSNQWLFPRDYLLPASVAKVMALLDWSSIPEEMQQGCEKACHFFDSKEHLPADIEPYLALKTLTQQMLLASDPSIVEEEPKTPLHQARLLSVYLRAYGLDLPHLLIPADENEMNQRLKAVALSKNPNQDLTEKLHLECPLTLSFTACKEEKKLENNLPKVTLRVKTPQKTEIIVLAFDRYGSGLKWPSSDGHLLFRFQPQFEKLPFKVRLRDARQISYPHSGQPFSYESDLWITDKRSKETVEATLSMNHVHETWDGYRFYLANISPPNETAPQRAQIIVNHDPGKYLLTYPGAVFLSMGILLLFWLNPYKKR